MPRPPHKPRQLDEIRYAEGRSPSGDDDEGIVHNGGRPTRQERLHLLSCIQVEDPVLTPTLAVVDQLELVSKQGVEGMGYPETSYLNVHIGCIRQLSPTPMSSV